MAKNNLKLKGINLRGYKSINSEGQDIPIGDITILLGANGAGKSNLISFFKMLNYMMTGALQKYIGDSGFADSLLHYGSKRTERIVADLTFANPQATNNYKFALTHAAGDILIFAEETVSYKKHDRDEPRTIQLEPGVKESGLYTHPHFRAGGDKTISYIYDLLKGCRVFQFHDTSKEAKIRNSGYINDGDFLRSDGGNLAAFLYTMRQQEDGDKYYQRIVKAIQMMMPQFNDFQLSPSRRNENYILLNWYETDSDYLFGPHQISDGALRFMALATLLLQPPKTLPQVIILDEPELGLHPSAIAYLAGMIKMASQQCQIVVATQSTILIDNFEASDIIVVERDERQKCSTYKQVNEDRLSEWLEQYSISELWEKNIIGGKP